MIAEGKQIMDAGRRNMQTIEYIYTHVKFIPGLLLKYCRIAEAKSKADSAGRMARPKRLSPNESGLTTDDLATENVLERR